MSNEPMQTAAASNPPCEAAKKKSRRRGAVLIAVLIVVTSLALAAYHYGDLMISEDKASIYAHRHVQAKAFADSGIHYAAALLSDPDSYMVTLGGNPWNNPTKFKDQLIQTDKRKGYFSIIAPSAGADLLYGVSDESAKINLNALMKSDPSGETLFAMLVKLPPPMTEEIATCIVDWLDPDIDVRGGGAENDYYMGLGYRCKNGPIDSLDELLLIKGITRQILYGNDTNRNGNQDGGEAGFDRGLSAFLTVHSREQNGRPDGVKLVYLNDPDPKAQYDAMLPIVGEDMAKFLYLCRRKGYTKSTPPANYRKKEMSEYVPDFEADALRFVLVPPNNFGPDSCTAYEVVGNVYSWVDQQTKTYYETPLKDYGANKDLLAKFVGAVTYQSPTADPADPATGPEIPARINVNTASKEVLMTLTEGVTTLTEADIDLLIAKRADLDWTSPLTYTTAWLLTDATIPLKTLRDVNCYKRITARTQIYRVQSVGYFEGKGPSMRVEAVIDTNSGRPRILEWRDLSELGKGFSDTGTTR